MANILQEQGGKLTPEQKKVALTVLRTGKRMGASPRQLITALITGIQESGLKNLPIGAESSGGWRQERAIYYPDPTNVKHSAERFFKELKERGGHGSVGEEAQATQRSAYPSAYQPHVGEARQILKRFNKQGLLGVPNGGTQVPLTPPKFKGAQASNSSAYKIAALNFIKERDQPGAVLNFVRQKQELSSASPAAVKPLGSSVSVQGSASGSGSGLASWATKVLGTSEGSPKQAKWAAASGISSSAPWCSAFVAYGLRKQGYKLPSDPAYSGSWMNWNQGKKVSYKNAKPGDLLIFDWGDGGITDHVAIYTGHGTMIGGNDSHNSVGKSSVPTGNIVSVIRPTKRR